LVCPDVITVSSNFLLGFYSTLKWQLQKYNAPPEAVAAKLKVKECIDTIPYLSRVSVEAAEVIFFPSLCMEGTGLPQR
jgi:hypothetical protein